MNLSRPFAVLGVCLVAGFAVFGVLVGKAVRTGREFDRYVTVRGLCEREVKADLVIWPLRFSAYGEDLAELKPALERDRATVRAFLSEAGIRDEEITVGVPVVGDRSDAKTQAENRDLKRYKAVTTLVVRSTNVDLVKTALQRADVLLERGVTLAEPEWGDRPQFLFRGVNEVKPDMIREATANARLAADKFAEDSKTVLGSIRRATQGALEMEDRDAATPERKLLRVVTTIDFFVR